MRNANFTMLTPMVRGFLNIWSQNVSFQIKVTLWRWKRYNMKGKRGNLGKFSRLVTKRKGSKNRVELGSAGCLQGKDHSHVMGHQDLWEQWAGAQAPLHPRYIPVQEQVLHIQPLFRCS